MKPILFINPESLVSVGTHHRHKKLVDPNPFRQPAWHSPELLQNIANAFELFVCLDARKVFSTWYNAKIMRRYLAQELPHFPYVLVDLDPTYDCKELYEQYAQDRDVVYVVRSATHVLKSFIHTKREEGVNILGIVDTQGYGLDSEGIAQLTHFAGTS